MMILILGLIFLGLVLNIMFYEYRVLKLTGKAPKEINLTGFRKWK